ERTTVVVALGENGVPRKPRLRAFQRQALEELAVVAHRHAPLLVVVGDGERVAWPLAALLLRLEKRGLSLIFGVLSHAVTTLRAKPPKRSRTRSRQAESGSSGASSSRGLMTRAHWKIENSA